MVRIGFFPRIFDLFINLQIWRFNPVMLFLGFVPYKKLNEWRENLGWWLFFVEEVILFQFSYIAVRKCMKWFFLLRSLRPQIRIMKTNHQFIFGTSIKLVVCKVTAANQVWSIQLHNTLALNCWRWKRHRTEHFRLQF